MKICNSTCTTVCHNGMRSPFTAFFTDGTRAVRVRSSHQANAAMDRPTNTDIARLHAGTSNGPGCPSPSTYPRNACSTAYSIRVSNPAATPMSIPITVTAMISDGSLPNLGSCRLASSAAFVPHGSVCIPAMSLQSACRRRLAPDSHRSTSRGRVGCLHRLAHPPTANRRV